MQDNLETVVRAFVWNFNQMCRQTGRSYLERPVSSSKSEDAGKTVRYKITYKMKRTDEGWEIYARWWILFFPKKAPLLKIKRVGSHAIVFEGLYVSGSHTIPQNAVALGTALNNYLNYCARLPAKSFVNV
jgi:hypothetical protein